MFFGRKDPGSKKGSGTASRDTAAAAPSRDSVLEAARKERELRAAVRDLSSFAVKIQRVVRGYVTRATLSKDHTANLNKKLSDLSKLSTALSARGVAFVPPTPVLAQLLGQLLLNRAAFEERIGALTSSDAAAIAGVFALCIASGKNDSGCLSVSVLGTTHCTFPLSGAGWYPRPPKKAKLTALKANSMEMAVRVAGDKPLMQSALSWQTLVCRSVRFAAGCILHLELPTAVRLVCMEWVSAVYSAAAAPLSSIIPKKFAEIDFVMKVARPAILALPPEPLASRIAVPETELSLASKILDVAVNVTMQQIAADPVEHSKLAAALLSIPYLMARCPHQKALLAHPDIICCALNGFVSFRHLCNARWDFGMLKMLHRQTIPGVKVTRRTLNAFVYPPAVVRQLNEWPIDILLAGNVLQGLSWRASASPSPTRNLPLAASLTSSQLTVILNFLVDVLDSFIPDFTSASTPVIWMVGGVRCNAGTLGAQVISMPGLLVQQLRCLSHESLARALAASSLAMNGSNLKESRLKLPDEHDEERASYHAYEIDVAAMGDGPSTLTAAPNIAVSVVRSLWEGSKLAVSFLRRKAVGGDVPSAAPTTTKTAEYTADRAILTPKAAAPVGGAFDTAAVYAFCRLFAAILAPVQSSVQSVRSEVEPVVGRRYVLSALAYTPSLHLVRRLWYFLVDNVDLKQLVEKSAYKSAVQPKGAFAVLTLLVLCFGHLVSVVDDFELYNQHTPLPLRELRHVIRLLRDIIAHAEGIGVDRYSTEVKEKLAAPQNPFWPRFAAAVVGLLRSLYDRHSQRPLGPQDMWLVNINKASIYIAGADREPEDATTIATRRLHAVMPFAVPFDTRSLLYQQVRDEDRRLRQEGMPQVRITVFRTRMLASTMSALEFVRGGDELKRKTYVTFINAEGMEESGVDAGGLFKELWTSVSKIVFDPSYGLFKVNDQGELYPNPDSRLCVDGPDEMSFEFVGRILGKALYEGITIGPRFARFFLHKLLGRPVNLHHLASLDPELYKSLMFLKTYEGDVSDLSLSFVGSTELTASAGGEQELIPGGSSIAVTNDNRMQYIYLMADWRLNKSIDRQCSAFLRGLRDLIPAGWLTSFSAPELQIIISGAAKGIDVADLQRYTQYGPGYHAVHPTISAFWDVVGGFSREDRAALLKFVTSCERPPPNGFRDLHPAFTIHKLGASSPDSMLPMASTCFNILKLPNYSNKSTMKAKLLAAIHSGAGFELT